MPRERNFLRERRDLFREKKSLIKENRLTKIALNWRIKAVLPHIRGRLLDIGCGTNALVKSYVGEGIGTDVYPWSNVDLIVKNSAELPFENETFDTVTIIAALNHIPNRGEVLTESHRVLRQNGRIIITMISPKVSRMWHFLCKLWDIDQKYRRMKQGEVFGLTLEEIHCLLSESKFDILFEKKYVLGRNCLTVAKKS